MWDVGERHGKECRELAVAAGFRGAQVLPVQFYGHVPPGRSTARDERRAVGLHPDNVETGRLRQGGVIRVFRIGAGGRIVRIRRIPFGRLFRGGVR